MLKRSLDLDVDASDESKDITIQERAIVSFEPIGGPCQYLYLRTGFSKKPRNDNLLDNLDEDENQSYSITNN